MYTNVGVVEELIGTATYTKDGLMPQILQTVPCKSMGRIMRVKKGAIVNFLLSSNHSYSLGNYLAIVQVVCADTYNSSVRYYNVIPKNDNNVRFDLRYVKAEDDSYVDLYISSDDPSVCILSITKPEKVELLRESCSEFPSNAIPATEV